MSTSRHVDLHVTHRRRLAAGAAVLTAALGPAFALTLYPPAAASASSTGRSGAATCVGLNAMRPTRAPECPDAPAPRSFPAERPAPQPTGDSARSRAGTTNDPLPTAGGSSTGSSRPSAAPGASEGGAGTGVGGGGSATGSNGGIAGEGSGAGTVGDAGGAQSEGNGNADGTASSGNPDTATAGGWNSTRGPNAGPVPTDPVLTSPQVDQSDASQYGIIGPDRAPANGSQPRKDLGSDPDLLGVPAEPDNGLIPASWAQHLPPREVGIQIFIGGLIALIISITGLVTVAVRRR